MTQSIARTISAIATLSMGGAALSNYCHARMPEVGGIHEQPSSPLTRSRELRDVLRRQHDESERSMAFHRRAAIDLARRVQEANERLLGEVSRFPEASHSDGRSVPRGKASEPRRARPTQKSGANVDEAVTSPQVESPQHTRKESLKAPRTVDAPPPKEPLAHVAATGVLPPIVRDGELSVADVKRRDESELALSHLADGAIGPVLGLEYVNEAGRGRPIYQVLGIRSDPTATFRGAQALAAETGRPVVPVMNDTAVRSVSEIVGPRVGGPIGTATDAGRALHDRVLDEDLALEEATTTLEREILASLALGYDVDVVAHSQGTVITQNAVRRVADTLDGMVAQGGMSHAERDRYLGLIRVVSAGSFATASAWPRGIRLVPLTNREDPVPFLGGWSPPSAIFDLDLSFQSHSYVDSYLQGIARILNTDQLEP